MYLPILPASIPARSVTQYLPAYTATDYLRQGDSSDGKPGGGGGGGPRKGLEEWSSLIGIITAIVGNVLIALALNVQRYAHIRLHREKVQNRERAKQALKNAKNGNGASQTGYGSVSESRGGAHTPGGGGGGDGDDDDAQGARESDPLTQSFQSGDSRWSDNSDDESATNNSSTSYLKSPYWWLGQILITVGEMGNFLAYGFAPASIVSPLGVVALVSNCIIAPIVFKEKFRKRDFWGVVIAVFGAVTVVLSANTQETKLDPHAVWDAITTTEFEIYMGVTCSLIVLLMWLSPKYGNRTILIDLGLVGLFGGYTVLSTKGVSSMLSSTLLRAFTTPVTYVLLLILLGTAIMQVRYVNKALQRFDSTQVIPIQFVSFTLCVIIGSAVLYRDFERTTSEQAVKFTGGCFLTFFGVFLITSGRDAADDDEDMLSDDDEVEETIGLEEQDPDDPPSPAQPRRRGSDAKSSRRSSRVSFMDAVNKPLAVLQESGVPTSRAPVTPTKASLLPSGEAGESAPLLRTRSPERRHNSTPAPVHPGIAHAMSSESAISISSATPISSEPPTHPGTPLGQVSTLPAINIPHDGSPVTPRPQSASRAHTHHHFTGPLFSPSPFHSTVSGLVPSNLVKDAHPVRRPSSRRRPSLRSSLYVSQDELNVEPIGEEEERVIMSAIERSRTADESQIPGGQGQQGQGGGGRKGVRARAKSLTNSVGDLFGVRRAKRDDGAPPREGAQGSQVGGDFSTETL